MNKLIIIFTLLLAGWFYWFQFRPSQIRKDCVEIAKDGAKRLAETQAKDPWEFDYQKAVKKGLFKTGDYDRYYQRCLNEHGLK